MTVKILKTTDKLKIKVGDVTFEVCALSKWQREQIAIAGIKDSSLPIGESNLNLNEMINETLKYSIKGIYGVEDINGNPYELEFSDDTKTALTDKCIDELNSFNVNMQLFTAISGVQNGIRGNKIYNPLDNTQVLEGVEIIMPSKKKQTRLKKK